MIVFAEEALDDLEHILSFNLEFDETWALEQIETIRSAILILDRHPHIGRVVEADLRELVISVGRKGYVALYQFEEFDSLVRILAVRHQSEAGYRGR